MSDVVKDWKLTAFHQKFSLPEALIYYIAKNPPSAKFYEKLIKCCQYFWLKNPIITLDGLSWYYRGKYWGTYKMNGFGERQRFEIENLNEKLWIYQTLSVRNDQNQFLASSLIPRIYMCNLTRLYLSDQTLSFDELKKFISPDSLECLDLHKTIVKNDNGTVVPMENLIELLPNLQSFQYRNVTTEDGLRTITSETAAKLNAIPHFPRRFYIFQIPESFDIDAFFSAPKVSNSIYFSIPRGQ